MLSEQSKRRLPAHKGVSLILILLVETSCMAKFLETLVADDFFCHIITGLYSRVLWAMQFSGQCKAGS